MMWLWMMACSQPVEAPQAPEVACDGKTVWTPSGKIDEAQAEVCQA